MSLSTSASVCNYSQGETRRFADSRSGSESESNWIDECAISEGSSFEDNALSFQKLPNNPPFQRPGAEIKSILSCEIHAAQLSDDARPLQDRETCQRMVKEEMNDHLREVLLHERNIGMSPYRQSHVPQAALSVEQCSEEYPQKPKIVSRARRSISGNRIEKSHGQAQSELECQDEESWAEIFKFCIW